MKFFKNSKNYLYGIQLYVLCLIVCVFLLFQSYDYRQNNCYLNYQRDLDMNSQLKIIRSTPAGMSSYSDKDAKLEKVYNDSEINHKVEKTTVALVVEDTESFHQNDKNWQKAKALRKPGHTKEKQTNITSSNLDPRKAITHINGNLINIKKESQTKDTYPGINATHINGILMEPVNAKYIRNIYFTIKTTHNYYTDRLFPLLLTWLQAVDRHASIMPE